MRHTEVGAAVNSSAGRVTFSATSSGVMGIVAMSSEVGHRRLAAIAGMLGSAHDGERANAARLATIELQRLGLTWYELVMRAFRAVVPAPAAPVYQEGWEPQRPQPRQYTAGQRWAKREGIQLYEFLRFAELHQLRLNSWEQRFVQSLLGIGPKVAATASQWNIIFMMADKLNVERRA